MQAKIKRLNPELEVPKYHTEEAAAFDIASAEDILVRPGETPLIRTGLIIQSPENHFLLIAARSSLPIKKGLMLANSIGIIDRDYCGPEDELKIQVYNFTQHDVRVEKGERIAQGIFLPARQAQFLETENIKNSSRGGHGGTGGYHA